MSHSEQTNSLHSESEQPRRPNSQPPLTSNQQNKSWPSLSSFMALLSGSRPNRPHVDIKQENETIDEELSW